MRYIQVEGSHNSPLKSNQDPNTEEKTIATSQLLRQYCEEATNFFLQLNVIYKQKSMTPLFFHHKKNVFCHNFCIVKHSFLHHPPFFITKIIHAWFHGCISPWQREASYPGCISPSQNIFFCFYFLHPKQYPLSQKLIKHGIPVVFSSSQKVIKPGILVVSFIHHKQYTCKIFGCIYPSHREVKHDTLEVFSSSQKIIKHGILVLFSSPQRQIKPGILAVFSSSHTFLE